MDKIVSLSQVIAKSQAFVDALCRLPEKQFVAVPHGHFGHDYNTLRRLAIEVLLGYDPRLFGPEVAVRVGPNGRKICDAHFVEIETYARQIHGQLLAAEAEVEFADAIEPSSPIVTIRQTHPNAYRAWTKREDDALRAQQQRGSSIEELAQLFGRQPGGIASRLRKFAVAEPLDDESDEFSIRDT